MAQNNYLSVDEKDMEKIEKSKALYRVKCQCGAKTTIVETDRKICYRCGRWVYKNEKTKFKYEMLKRLKEASTNGY